MTDSIGSRLRQARELRNLTLQQVSETTKVRTHYLQALENDDHSAIPSAAQARGFLRIYAAFLDLDLANLIPPALAATPAPAAEVAVAPTPQPARLGGVLASLRQRFTRRAGANGSSTSEIPPAPRLESKPETAAPVAPLAEAAPEATPKVESSKPVEPKSASASPTVKKKAEK